LPENAEATILKKLKPPKPGEETPEGTPEQHGGLDNPADRDADARYDRATRLGMQRLLEATAAAGAKGVKAKTAEAGTFDARSGQAAALAVPAFDDKSQAQ